MEDPLLVGVLHAGTDLAEELDPVGDREAVVVAILRDGKALDVFHHEVGLALFVGAGIQDAGDGGMVHHGQGLALGGEPAEHVPGVHARLDQLQGDQAVDGPGLLGQDTPSSPPRR